MQNQGPPYQGGPVNQGSYPDHNYNSQMGGHCPPGGYQPYANGPYTHGNPRTHHYGNHQMQQGPPRNQIPYGGNYAAPPNQYGPPPGQEMYRNPHHMYPGGNNRNMHGKPAWGENNSSEMMPTYNHGPPHQQMMNNSAPMSMRSPPHLATNVHSPGSQHYRQMQSPGHSPQTWPQVQVPSPGMHPVARTTPSPLQTHARSPGHSQPFSPSAATHMPAAVNMPSHPIPSVVPESPQPAQVVSQGMMAAGPLHSLQKMVMLDQDHPMQMNCDMVNENSCDRLPQCVPNSVTQVENSPHDDSSIATYYNMDENRLESKPQTNMGYQSTDYTMNTLSEVPAPMINERLPSHMQHVPEVHVKQPPYTNSSTTETRSYGHLPNGLPSSHPNIISLRKADVSENLTNDSELQSMQNCSTSVTNVAPMKSGETCLPQDSSTDQKDNAVQRNGSVNPNSSDLPKPDEKGLKNVSPDDKEAASAQSTVSAQSVNDDIKKECVIGSPNQVPDSEEDNLITESNAAEDVVSEIKENHEQSTKDKVFNSSGIKTNKTVTVVIHRIRKDDTDDTWHVPNSKDGSSTLKVPAAARSSKPGPQIIKLTSSASPNKTEIEDLVPTIKTEIKEEGEEEKVDLEVELCCNSDDVSTPANSRGKRKGSKALEEENVFSKPLPKPTAPKRSKPTGAKSKTSPAKKRRRGKGKFAKKKKPEVNEVELPPKPKKQKPFTGPYVRVLGTKANPSSITVINVAIKEEEKGKPMSRSKAEGSLVKKPRVGHTSTLSPHYDAFNKDRTWLCAFCLRGSHCNGLGDLYGPYYVKDEAASLSANKTVPAKSGARSKRRKSDATAAETPKTSHPSNKKMSKMVCKLASSAEPNVTPLSTHTASSLPTSSPNEVSDQQEIWIHEDCAVWCQGVSLMGIQIFGLEEAIKEASENICSSCKMIGATLGCWRKGCTEQYHFCCAKEKGCKLDIEKFSLFCPKHKVQSKEIKKEGSAVEKRKRTL